MAVRQTSSSNLPGILGRFIPSETAVTTFQLATGVFGGVAALIASRRLAAFGDRITIGRLLPAIAVAGVSTAVGALLLPTGE